MAIGRIRWNMPDGAVLFGKNDGARFLRCCELIVCHQSLASAVHLALKLPLLLATVAVYLTLKPSAKA